MIGALLVPLDVEMENVSEMQSPIKPPDGGNKVNDDLGTFSFGAHSPLVVAVGVAEVVPTAGPAIWND